jgi:hypothetical protein
MRFQCALGDDGLHQWVLPEWWRALPPLWQCCGVGLKVPRQQDVLLYSVALAVTNDLVQVRRVFAKSGSPDVLWILQL